MKNDSATDLAVARLAQAIRDYTPLHPTKYQKLLPMKDSITELRSKRASYAIIADILRNINVPVARDTVFRFCHEVLGGPMTRRRRRRKVAAIVPKERAREKSRTENARNLGNLQGKSDSQPAASWVRSTGPCIADPNTI